MNISKLPKHIRTSKITKTKRFTVGTILVTPDFRSYKYTHITTPCYLWLETNLSNQTISIGKFTKKQDYPLGAISIINGEKFTYVKVGKKEESV